VFCSLCRDKTKVEITGGTAIKDSI
jgi:hypothetical protein